MNKFILRVLSLFALTGIVACSGVERGDHDYPKTREEIQEERVGKLTGEGIVLIGGKRKTGAYSDGINVNSYLWRATLDTIHFMPIISADPFGGTIMTDWYKSSDSAKERYKLNIFILGADLRSDAIKVTAFKQRQDGKGAWHDTTVGPEMALEIEEKILLRSREIKYGSEN